MTEQEHLYNKHLDLATTITQRLAGAAYSTIAGLSPVELKESLDTYIHEANLAKKQLDSIVTGVCNLYTKELGVGKLKELKDYE